MILQPNSKFVLQATLVALLSLGVYLVLAPFMAAVLFSAVIGVTTWPLYIVLRRRMGGRGALSALVMSVFLALFLLVPTVLLSLNLADNLGLLIDKIRALIQAGLGAPPVWLKKIPLIGTMLESQWERFAQSREALVGLLQGWIEPGSQLLLQSVGLLGQGAIQLLLVLFIVFFLYRDGEAIGGVLSRAAQRLGGEVGVEMLLLTRNTIMGVMLGIVGTAAGQALVMLVGLVMAAVPGAVLLSAATFFLSMVPVGPPLVWGGAAIWLYYQGESGWAVFMVIYGLLVVSSVDNFLKPILISRSSSLPILLIALGVFGGIIAFGFTGIFIGPVVLALGQVLISHWTSRD